MGRTAGKLTLIMIMVIGSIFVGTIFSYRSAPQNDTSQADFQGATVTPLATPTETIPPNTPLPTLTPSQTLLPPPTFEPPTATPTITPIPSQAPTATTIVEVSIPGLNGAETPTPSTTPGCVPRKDWKLTYTVQFDDTLSAIAAKYNTWVEDLVDANCIKDKNLIVIGQVLRVPGEVQPASQEVACVPWQVLTPINGAVTVPADGSVTFNWIGPAAPINLIRIFRPDGSKYEVVIELRQNESINLNDNLAEAGTYTWYVYPLGRDFQQIQCLEGGPWTFTKPQSSTPTPTPSASSGGGGQGS
jgi:LysM repeat protein